MAKAKWQLVVGRYARNAFEAKDVDKPRVRVSHRRNFTLHNIFISQCGVTFIRSILECTMMVSKVYTCSIAWRKRRGASKNVHVVVIHREDSSMFHCKVDSRFAIDSKERERWFTTKHFATNCALQPIERQNEHEVDLGMIGALCKTILVGQLFTNITVAKF